MGDTESDYDKPLFTNQYHIAAQFNLANMF